MKSDSGNMARHVDRKLGPPEKNQLADEVDRLLKDRNNPLAARLLKLSKAYQEGGKPAHPKGGRKNC